MWLITQFILFAKWAKEIWIESIIIIALSSAFLKQKEFNVFLFHVESLINISFSHFIYTTSLVSQEWVWNRHYFRGLFLTSKKKKICILSTSYSEQALSWNNNDECIRFYCIDCPRKKMKQTNILINDRVPENQ